MKKLSFLFAMIFAVSMAMAQTAPDTAYVDQSGSGTAVITQGTNPSTGNSGSNYAYIKQLGDGNSTITQSGENNFASSTTAGGVISTQLQSGDDNSAILGQGFVQTGNVRQQQYGNENTISLTVTGPGTRGVNILQEQIGHENTSEIVNYRSDGDAFTTDYTKQYGLNNDIKLDYISNSQRNGFQVEQNGEMNDLFIEFYGHRNEIKAVQSNDNNSIDLKLSDGSVADIFQSGDGNKLKGIGAEGQAKSLAGSELMLTQYGGGNTLQLDQSNGFADVLQTGGANDAIVSQGGIVTLSVPTVPTPAVTR